MSLYDVFVPGVKSSGAFAIDLTWACQGCGELTSLIPLVMSSSSLVVICDHLAGSLNDLVLCRYCPIGSVEVHRLGRALALLVKEQHADGGERLCHRTDVETRVGSDRRLRRQVCDAISLRSTTCPSVTIATEMPGKSFRSR